MNERKKVWTSGQWHEPDAIWGTCAKCGRQITMGESAYGDVKGRMPCARYVENLGHQVLCGACAEEI